MIRFLDKRANGTRTLTVPAGRTGEVIAEHPERTTVRNVGAWDVGYREWQSAGAARTAVRMARSGVNPANLRMMRPEDRS